MEILVRRCIDCGSNLTGRKGRKFCSDSCRINYHNTLAQNENPIIRKVDRILRRNRSILEKMFLAGKIQTTRKELELNGYLSEWNTGKATIGPELSLIAAYDYGIVWEDHENCQVVHFHLSL